MIPSVPRMTRAALTAARARQCHHFVHLRTKNTMKFSRTLIVVLAAIVASSMPAVVHSSSNACTMEGSCFADAGVVEGLTWTCDLLQATAWCFKLGMEDST